MNTKRFLALVLVLMMVLVLTPERAAKAEEKERLCPNCRNPLHGSWTGSIWTHAWCCDNCNYKEEEDHTLDGNCLCSICKHYCHSALVFIGFDVHTQPTCTEPGLDYDSNLYLCRHCGNYTDNTGNIVTPITAPALGHDWSAWNYRWEGVGDGTYTIVHQDSIVLSAVFVREADMPIEGNPTVSTIGRITGTAPAPVPAPADARKPRTTTSLWMFRPRTPPARRRG